jgi:transcriptional regulator with XRE-family HTH domain
MAKKSCNPIDVIVGKKIRARRVEAKISQAMLGQALGIAFQQIQKYEAGINRVTASRLYEIGTILKVPVSYFYDGLQQALKIESPVSDEMMIGRALDRIKHRSRRELAVKLVLALLLALESD